MQIPAWEIGRTMSQVLMEFTYSSGAIGHMDFRQETIRGDGPMKLTSLHGIS